MTLPIHLPAHVPPAPAPRVFNCYYDGQPITVPEGRTIEDYRVGGRLVCDAHRARAELNGGGAR